MTAALKKAVIDFTRFGEADYLYGFTPSQTIAGLRLNGTSDLPAMPGVYMVFTPDAFVPDFLPTSCARPRKGKLPTISPELLRAEHWVPESRVIYIGKAGGENKSTIRSRVKQFIDSADGRQAANQHWGGRLIWQLGNIDVCRFAVLPLPVTENPATVESALLRHFDAFFNAAKNQQRVLPFANIRW